MLFELLHHAYNLIVYRIYVPIPGGVIDADSPLLDPFFALIGL